MRLHMKVSNKAGSNQQGWMLHEIEYNKTNIDNRQGNFIFCCAIMSSRSSLGSKLVECSCWDYTSKLLQIIRKALVQSSSVCKFHTELWNRLTSYTQLLVGEDLRIYTFANVKPQYSKWFPQRRSGYNGPVMWWGTPAQHFRESIGRMLWNVIIPERASQR